LSQSGKTQAEEAKLLRPQDPFEMLIQEEVEEFLRDLALEYPFQEVFETLRRFEFIERYGAKVIPLPKRTALGNEAQLKDIKERINSFLGDLEEQFGPKYGPHIQNSFRFYTETTRD